MHVVRTGPKPRAILFDLFNTLIPGGARSERDLVSQRMAVLLSVDASALAALIRSTFDERTRGLPGDLDNTVRALARRLGAEPDDAAIEAAVELRLAMTRGLHQQAWCLNELAALRQQGLRLGLVSDCSAETPRIWPESPLSSYFDALSFSCVTGHRKPEAEAYLTAVRQLGLEPANCVFIGDGGSHELTGAAALGMQVYRFRPTHSNLGDLIDEDDEWVGHTVTDFHDLAAVMSH